MKRLYLIGGPMGVGKTTVCQELKRLTAPSVFLDGDWCWDMEPFQVTAETKAMVQENIAFLLGQFLRCSAYETVIFCWVMHQREIIQELLASLPLEGVEVRAVSLLATAETLQARIGKDVAAGLRTWDVLERSLQRLPLYQDLPTEKLWVDDGTARERGKSHGGRDFNRGPGDGPGGAPGGVCPPYPLQECRLCPPGAGVPGGERGGGRPPLPGAGPAGAGGGHLPAGAGAAGLGLFHPGAVLPGRGADESVPQLLAGLSVFQEGRPVGIIDWDAAAFGHPLDDLAYALWLWLDLGNEEYSYATVRQRMGVMLDAYGVAAGERPGMGERIHRQMERVAQSVFPTPQQTAATSQWARRSQTWLRGFWNSLYPGRL